MSDLVIQDAPKGISVPGVVAGAKIQSLIPTDFEGAWRMAQVISHSPFVPKDMQSVEACCSAIMLGLDVGLTPIQAVQSIAVINGRPSIWGDAALALCLANTILCEDITEEFSGDDKDETTWLWTCTAKRKGRSKPTVSTFTYSDAKRANLWTKAGPWTQYPKRMLQLRARAFALRDAFPDILKGLAIREEMEDVDHAPSRGRADPPKPPGAEIPDAQVRDVTGQPDTGTAAAAEPEKAKEDPKPKSEPKPPSEEKQEPTKSTDAKPDQDAKPSEEKKPDTPAGATQAEYDELAEMFAKADTLEALDKVVTKVRGKPSKGMLISDKFTPEQREAMKGVYLARKQALSTKPADQQQGGDQQDGGTGEDTATQLFEQIKGLFAGAKDTNTLDACMNQFDEQIADMPKAMRDEIEDLYTKAGERLAEESARTDGSQQAGQQQEEAGASKDPAEMSGEEYVAYVERYIDGATDFDVMKKTFFGEANLRGEMVEKSLITKDQASALRTRFKAKQEAMGR